MTLRRSRLLLTAGVTAAALAPAAPALASGTQESIIEDDAQLLSPDPRIQADGLTQMKALGADTIRVRISWRNFAYNPTSNARPALDLSNPNAYTNWGPLDAVLLGARQRGLGVLLSVGGPGPNWATRDSRDCAGPNKRGICYPNAVLYGRFLRALGTRYSGRFSGLPRVSRWSIWNEPNFGSQWLQPQYVNRVLRSPAIYRDLVREGFSGLALSGHARDQVMLGETAPSGSYRRLWGAANTQPEDFIRGLFCVDARGRKLTGGAASDLRCGNFRRLPGNAYAHHVYGIGASSSPTTRGRPGEIRLADRGKLSRILDAARRNGRVGGLGIYWTEYGIQTNPPDRGVGVSLATQAERINQADYLSWRDGAVRSVSQYALVDDRTLAGFQTGLRFYGGRIKQPSYDAYRLPIFVVRSGNGAYVWGQVRPLRNYQRATITISTRSGRSWTRRTVARIGGKKGYFRIYVRGRYDGYRFQWDRFRSRDAVAR
jgi:hypothetical protein